MHVDKQPPYAVHLSIVSGQPDPVFLAALAPELRADTLVLVHTEQSASTARRLAEVLKNAYRGKVQLRQLSTSLKLFEIENQFSQWLSEFTQNNAPVVVNITGGTKVMAIAAYVAAENANGRVVYVQSGKVHELRDGSSKPIDCSYKPQQLARIRGMAINRRHDQLECRSKYRKLVKNWLKYSQQHDQVFKCFNWFVSQKCDPKTNTIPLDESQISEIKLTREDKALFWRLFEELEQYKLGSLKSKDNVFEFANEQALGFARGGWFEMAVEFAMNDLKQKNKAEQLMLVGRNIELCFEDHGDGKTRNEIDYLAICRHRWHLVECKVRDFRQQRGRLHPDYRDALYKLASLKKDIGGLQAKAMLLTCWSLSHEDKKRAEVHDIEIRSGANIDSLASILAEWLRMPASTL
jgi:hypothetical protein